MSKVSGFPGSAVSKESAIYAGDPGLIPGLGRYPGEGNGNPLKYCCLGNPMDRGAWRPIIVHGITTVGHDLATKPLQYFTRWFQNFDCFIKSIMPWIKWLGIFWPITFLMIVKTTEFALLNFYLKHIVITSVK